MTTWTIPTDITRKLRDDAITVLEFAVEFAEAGSIMPIRSAIVHADYRINGREHALVMCTFAKRTGGPKPAPSEMPNVLRGCIADLREMMIPADAVQGTVDPAVQS